MATFGMPTNVRRSTAAKCGDSLSVAIVFISASRTSYPWLCSSWQCSLHVQVAHFFMLHAVLIHCPINTTCLCFAHYFDLCGIHAGRVWRTLLKFQACRCITSFVYCFFVDELGSTSGWSQCDICRDATFNPPWDVLCSENNTCFVITRQPLHNYKFNRRDFVVSRPTLYLLPTEVVKQEMLKND
jgi:hypothetical protein